MSLHEMLISILCGVLLGVLIIVCTISFAIHLGKRARKKDPYRNRGYARPEKNTLVDLDSSLEDE